MFLLILHVLLFSLSFYFNSIQIYQDMAHIYSFWMGCPLLKIENGDGLWLLFQSVNMVHVLFWLFHLGRQFEYHYLLVGCHHSPVHLINVVSVLFWESRGFCLFQYCCVFNCFSSLSLLVLILLFAILLAWSTMNFESVLCVNAFMTMVCDILI